MVISGRFIEAPGLTEIDAARVTIVDNDTPGVSVSRSRIRVAEGGSRTYAIRLDSQPTGNVTVTPESADGEAATVSGALTFTPDDWDEEKQVTVSGVQDDDSNDEEVTVTHAASGAEYGGVAVADVAVRVQDDDGITVSVEFDSTEVSVLESAGTVRIEVIATTDADHAPSNELRVPVASADGTATAGSDYAGVGGAGGATVLVFDSTDFERVESAGGHVYQARHTMDIAILDDELIEGDETFSVLLGPFSDFNDLDGPDVAMSTGPEAIVTITEDDLPPITLTLDPDRVGEGTRLASVSVTATLNEDMPNTRTLIYLKIGEGGTAVQGVDYSIGGLPRVLVVTASQRSATVSLTLWPVGDAIAEGDETLIIAATVNADPEETSAVLTLTDDDSAGVTVHPESVSVTEGSAVSYTVALTSQPEGTVSVRPASGDTDLATVSDTLIFTPENWSDGQPVTVTGVHDADGVDERVSVTHEVAGYGAVTEAAAVAVTVTDDDEPGVEASQTQLEVPEGGSVRYTIVLNTQPTTAVTVIPVSSDSDAATVSGVLTFTPINWFDAQPVTVTGVQDPDAANEAVSVTHRVLSSEEYADLETPIAQATVIDDEEVSTAVTLTLNPERLGEGDPAKVVTVSASLSAAPRTTETAVSVTVTGGTATAETDFEPVSDFTLTIPQGSTSTTGTFTLTAVGDELDEDDETVEVNGSVSAAGLTVFPATLTIQDDDTRGVTVSETSLSFSEGGSETYKVVLTSQPTENVTVDVIVPQGTDVSANPTSLTFTPETWRDPKTVTVSAAKDDDSSVDAAVIITHSVSGGDYDGETASDVEVKIGETTPAFTDGNQATRSVAENSVQGTNVGAPVTATDPDAGDTLSYGITGPNPGGFTIDATTGQLRSGPAESYDFEDPTKNSYTVTVTATDSQGGSGSVEVTVTVTDVAEPPGKAAVSIEGQTLTSLTIEWAAPENAGRPAITDYDVGYRRASDVGWTPHPHQGTGLSAVIESLDPGTDYLVRVMARNDEGDGEWSDTAQGTTVANSAPEFGADTASRSVAENSVQGTNVGAPVTATDPDAGDTLSYGITGPNPGGFTIDATTGQLRSGPAESYDFEDPTKNSYTVTVTATDPQGGSGSVEVTVTVSDVDEPPGRPAVSISGQTLTSLTVEWTAPENAGRPAITDYDVEYRRASDSDWTAHAHAGTGLSAVIESLTPGTDYQVRVLARNDEGDGPWSDAAQGTTVANSAPDFGTAAASRSVPENSPSGTSVGAPVTATDEDNDTLSYGLVGADASSFEIDGDGQITVGTGTVLDHETGRSYAVTVTATDGRGASASIEVTVTVTDVNEAPAFEESSPARQLPENTGNVALGAPVTASDEDVGDALTYTVTGTNPGGFTIDEQTGQLMSGPAERYDFEDSTKSSYAVTVTATDGLGLTASIEVTVTITDADEPPGRPTVSISGQTLTSLTVAWTAPDNAGRPAITDYDVEYRRVSDAGWTEHPQDGTGLSAVIESLTPGTDYQVRVLARNDEGDGPWSDAAQGTTVANTAPIFEDDESTTTRSLPENSPQGTSVGAPVTATDTDAGDTLGYTVTGPNPGGFTIDATTGQLRSGPAENYDFEDPAKSSYTVTVTATDGMEVNASIEVTVTVTDADEPPGRPTVSISGQTLSSLTVEWDAPENAGRPAITDYDVEYRRASDVGWTDHPHQGTGLSAVIGDLDPGTDYLVRVLARNDEGDGEWSDTARGATVANSAPDFGAASASRSVPENSPSGTSVGAPVTATDEDAGDTLTYGLEGADASSFEIDADGQITVGAGTVLDHEAGRSYAVTVTATDGLGLTDSVEVTVTVTDVDEPPGRPAVSISGQTLSSLTVEWTAPDNAGRPAITDYDVGYRRASDSSWTEHPHEGTGLRAVIESLDPGTDYQVRVLARNDEGDGPWSDAAQGRTVASSAPDFGADAASRSVPENSPSGTSVGEPVTATDEDAGDTLTYGITGPNPGGFTIDGQTGQLKSGPAERYDFEDPAKSSYAVTVTATDGLGLTDSIEVTVTVTDVDEPPGRPTVSISGQTLSSLTVEWAAPENAGRPAITDYDVGYRRASDVGWTPHPHEGTGLSAVIGDLDSGTDYLVRVMARNDEGDGEWSDTARGTTVANSDPIVAGDENTTTRSLPENSVQGTNVGAPVTATDPDAGDTLSYGITGPNPGGFTIDATTGQLRSGPAESYDFEDPTKNSYTVTVTATDSQGGSGSVEVTVTVSDVDEPPGKAAVSIEGQTLSSLTVEWTAPDNAGRPAITDYDVGYRRASDVGWTPHPHQGTGLTAVIESLDPGTDYLVRVLARNDEGDGEWSDAAQGRTVANSAPDFGADAASRSVPENSPSGTSVGEPVTATDEDAGDTLTYGLEGADASSFDIDESGQIKVAAGTILDHEAGRSYAVTVTATDSQGGSGSVEVRVTVTDVDEPPGKATVSIEGQTLSSLTVEWTAPDNAGRPAITDYDVGYRRASDSSWTEHPHEGTGLRAVIESLDPGTDYQVRVLARNDEGDGPWSDAAQGRTVASSAPDFGADAASRSVPENSPSGTSVGEPVTATDEDAGDTLTYGITGPNPGGFTIDGQTGQLKSGPAERYDFEDPAKSSYAVTVTATDGLGLTDSIEVTVTVTDVEEPPGRPAVSISGQTLSSLTVEWAAPENAGRPAITDYDVGYRRASDVGWTPHPHEGTGLSAVIGDLDPGTDYLVRVMARNDEGDGEWSDTAQGTTVANSAPEFGADTASRSVAENSVQGTNVGAPVTATDPDAGDTLSYGITGPNPGGFTIDATTGQLRSGPAESYDFEDPTKNSYTVTVTATDSQGGSGSVEVTVTVSDVDEPPGRPAVSIEGQTLSSLTVEWTAPDNAGRPAITDYDVGYRRASDVGWTDHPHQGTGLSAVIGDLASGTDYLVRVMARNDEGDGEWSDTARGTTVANSDPIVAGDENTTTRSLPENSVQGTNVGAPVTATDPDAGDTLSYGITGPNPGGFTIDATTGQLRSGPAESYDFEDPTKNSYTVTVTATDSQGGSGSVEVTVTVSDVAEPPGRPAVSISGQTLSSLTD